MTRRSIGHALQSRVRDEHCAHFKPFFFPLRCNQVWKHPTTFITRRNFQGICSSLPPLSAWNVVTNFCHPALYPSTKECPHLCTWSYSTCCSRRNRIVNVCATVWCTLTCASRTWGLCTISNSWLTPQGAILKPNPRAPSFLHRLMFLEPGTAISFTDAHPPPIIHHV